MSKWHSLSPFHRRLTKLPSSDKHPVILAEKDGYEYDLRLVLCQGNLTVERTDMDGMDERYWRKASADEIAEWLFEALFPEKDRS